MTYEDDLLRVTRNGLALRYVQNQTPELCMAAVTQNGHALQYVQNQTPEICIAAVMRIGYALEHVTNQTPEICTAAVAENGWALQYVADQTPELCMAAVARSATALRYVKIPSLNYTNVPEDVEAKRWAEVCKHAKLGLDMSQWHAPFQWDPEKPGTCGTTHCLAGWAQALSTDMEIRRASAIIAGLALIPRHAHLFFHGTEEVLALIESESTK